MEKIPSHNKLPEDEAKKLKKVFERTKEEVPYEFTVEEDADTVMVRRKDEDGKEVGMGFTKIGKKIMLADGKKYCFSHIVEARMRFPKDGVIEALRKLYEENSELEKENEEKNGGD